MIEHKEIMNHNLNFQDSSKRLSKILNDTRLIHSKVFSEISGNQVYIKPENLQTTGSFKIRGAYNKVSKLSEEERNHGLIASSAGNHAQGVAYAAQSLGVKATIVMPKTTPLIKVEATRKYGADVVLHGDVYDEAYEEACRLEKENNYVFIHPFDDLDVIEGQGTIALEIFNELEDVDCILVPIGGGGLISGVALAAKSINPNVKIIGVEPEGAKSMMDSLEQGKIISLDMVNTIADGTAVKTPGNLTYEITRDYVDEIVTVSDLEIMEAFLTLVQSHKLIAENSGLLSLAALKKIKEKDKKIVSLISGGNIDILTISGLIDKGLVSTGRISCFAVTLKDKPGELQKISDILSNLGANIIDVSHDSRRGLTSFTDVNVNITVETNGFTHIQNIVQEIPKYGYHIENVY
ncbi:threonine ammonia-lyase [Wansuia hejianensis]|nr:threonine ammonia-lyase [Wansuia hejianensis]